MAMPMATAVAPAKSLHNARTLCAGRPLILSRRAGVLASRKNAGRQVVRVMAARKNTKTTEAPAPTPVEQVAPTPAGPPPPGYTAPPTPGYTLPPGAYYYDPATGQPVAPQYQTYMAPPTAPAPPKSSGSSTPPWMWIALGAVLFGGGLKIVEFMGGAKQRMQDAAMQQVWSEKG